MGSHLKEKEGKLLSIRHDYLYIFWVKIEIKILKNNINDSKLKYPFIYLFFLNYDLIEQNTALDFPINQLKKEIYPTNKFAMY